VKKKTIILVVLLFIVGIASYFLYVDLAESQFTEEDTITELKKSDSADVRLRAVVDIINSLPNQNETEYIRGDFSSYDKECSYSKIVKKSGSKSRYCEKVVIAYIGVSENEKDSALAYLISMFNNDPRFVKLSKSDDKKVEEYYLQKSYSNSKLAVKLQSKEKNDFRSMPKLLENYDYVVDVYYYDKYSEITKSINIFEYFLSN
jgi:hypothetical protein